MTYTSGDGSASPSKDSSTSSRASTGQRSVNYTSVEGWIELTENTSIDDNLRDFVKDLKTEAAGLSNSRLRDVRLFYSSPDADFTREHPFKVKDPDKYEKISEGKSTKSFVKAFLDTERGFKTYFRADKAGSSVLYRLMDSVREKAGSG